MKHTPILAIIVIVLAGCGDRFTSQQKATLDRETWKNYGNIGNLGIGFVPYHDAIHGYHYSLASTKDYNVKWSFVMMEIAGDLRQLDFRHDAKTVIIGLDQEVENTQELKKETEQNIKEKLRILDIIDPEDVYKIGAPIREKYGS